MVTYALDSSALLRYIDDATGADRVAEILVAKAAGTNHVTMSAIYWGEVVGIMHKRHGAPAVESVLLAIRSLAITIISATADRAANSATLRHKYRIPYADCFGLDLAWDSPEHYFLTADFDLKPAQTDFRIEFLPSEPKP